MDFFLSCALSVSLLYTQALGNQLIFSASALVPALTPIAKVSIVKNGVQLIQFNSFGARALLEDMHLSIEINSPDLKHSLVIEIENAEVGNFPIVKETKSHCAVLNFMDTSFELMLSPTKGYFKLEKWSNGSCNGNFNGELTNDLGDHFQIKGNFESIVIKTL